MGVLAIIAICVGSAMIVGIPIGLIWGRKAAVEGANTWAALFTGAMTIYLIQSMLLLIGAITFMLIMEGKLAEDATQLFQKALNFARFSVLPAIIAAPIYIVVFLTSRAMAS